MNKKNMLFVYLFLLGLTAIAIGANLKLNGNTNAHYSLITGMLLQIISVLGIVINNIRKIKILLK